MSMTDEIANELILTSMILHTNVVSTMAQELGYRPMLIISAMYRGEESGKFKYNKKSDTIQIEDGVELDSLVVSEAMRELISLIEEFVGYLNNKDEKDMTVEELMMLLGGVPDLHIRIAARQSKLLTTYEIADPQDKESVYTFITLKGNEDKGWGLKQFDTSKKKKARNLQDATIKEAKKAKA